MSDKLKIGIMVAVAVAFVGGFFLAKEKFSDQSRVIAKIDEHLSIDETLRDVNFCGKTYKVRQIMIDEADVVQRIAELATTNAIAWTQSRGLVAGVEKTLPVDGSVVSAYICRSVELTTDEVIEATPALSAGWEQGGRYPGKSNHLGHHAYDFTISFLRFNFDVETNELYVIDGYTGHIIGPIGKLLEKDVIRIFNTIDQHISVNETLRDVNFCGKVYQVKQVMIDGVDVVQRIAVLATNDVIPEHAGEWRTTPLQNGIDINSVCHSINLRSSREPITLNIPTPFANHVGITGYEFHFFDRWFAFDVNTGGIYTDDADTGEIIGPFARLK